MRNSGRKSIVFLVAMLLCACATSGALYRDVAPTLSPLSSAQSRIIMYRARTDSAVIVQPSLYLDGKKIGDAVAGSFIMAEVKPGAHEISGATENNEAISITTKPRKTSYVEMSTGFGVLTGRMELKEVPESKAMKDIDDYHLQSGGA